MSSSYKYLTDKDRLFLNILLDRKVSKAKIAEILGVHRSTVVAQIRSDLSYYK